LGQFATGQNDRWAQANRYRSEYTYDANGNIESVERYDADGTGHYDSFAYHYHTIGGRKQQNRLYELIDDATMSTGSDIVTIATGFDNTSNGVNVNNNYGYDALGNLVRDDREEIELIHWTVAGKVDSIQRPDASSRSPLKFRYGASGQRVSKQVGDFYCTEPGSYREHYIRDAQGNIMATYRYKLLPLPNTTPQVYEASLKLNERPLYGSSRLGSLRTEVELRSLPSFDPTSANPMQQVDLNYELTDHLGNVCAVVTGRLLDGNGGGTPKQAELVSAQGYEAFGSLLPGRNYSSDSYRFGFGGMPKDDEVFGATGTSYTTEWRQHDPRVGRWWSVDPESSHPLMIGISPYSYCYNNPNVFVDKDGDLPIPLITGIGGALGAGIYGLVTGKSGKEIGALMVGGFVAGATLGLAPVAVAGMGGMAAIGGSSTAMVYGGAGIAGGLLGNGTKQGLQVAMGIQNEIDENEVLMSGVLGIYEPMLGGAASRLGQPVRNAFSSFLRSQTSQEVSAKAKSAMIKSVAGDLKAQSSLQGATLSDRKASRLAGKLVDDFIGFVDEMRQQETKVVDFTIKLFENGQGASINAILEGGKGAAINAISDEED
jgi:RHS repeat-associated protein